MPQTTIAEIGADQPNPPPGRNAGGVWGRYHNLRIGGRLGLGFAVVFALVAVLAVSGWVFLQAVLWGVDGFSRRGEVAGAAAELEIGLRSLEIAVRDQLNDGDVDSFEEANHHRDAMLARLDILDAAADGDDVKSVTTARTALNAYWDGFRRIIDLKTQRAEVVEVEAPRWMAAIRAGLDRLKDVGGVDSAAVTGEAGTRTAAALDMGLRFAERRDMMDGERAQNEFAAVRERLAELNRYRWVAGVADNLAAVLAGLDALERSLERLDSLTVAQDALRADVLAPNAAVVAERARALRQSGERAAAQLRETLGARAWDFARVAAWVVGGVLVVSLLTAWWTARSVSRPVRGLAAELAELAADSAGDADSDLGGHSTPSSPALSSARRRVSHAHNDEIADLGRALDVVRANTVQLRQALAETMAERDQLAAQARRLAGANAAKSDFLINMGQTLHGPLNDMAAQSQALMTGLHGHGLVEMANDAEAMQWTAERLAGRLDALMDYARIEAGQHELCLQDFDVTRLVVEVRERAMAEADLHGVALTATAAANAGGMHSDFAKVRQILLNLLDNACVHAGGAAVALTAERTERDGRGWLSFTVVDDGAGFSAAQAADLFLPFAKGAKACGGTGLGLTLVAHYTALLGGEIDVAAALGRGVRFTVRLPAVHMAEDEARPLRVRFGAPDAPLSPPQALLEGGYQSHS